eukprot:TRINITY_DN4131_c0_g1_i22.p1 TRINITY_DN4131_c0_g1~~TRINITY_DN4131_c0_g1_i22.p1  ORF type:complete len:205 (-),score=24.62 TRINITY_DN4131_c0_g1_i22:557-1090(-)
MLALSFLPVFWGHMDKVAVRLGQSQWHGALLYGVGMVGDILVWRPVALACMWALTRMARRRLDSCCADITVSLGVATFWTGFGLVLQFLHILVVKALGPLAIIAFCCLMVIPVCLVYGVRVHSRLSGARADGSMSSRQQPIHAGFGADIASDAAVNVLGKGSDQLDEADSEDSTLWI